MMKRLRRMNDQRKTDRTVTPVPQVHVGGSSGSGGHGNSVSPTPTVQRVVVPPEVPQDTRTSIIEDMEISQLKVKKEIKRSES